MMLKHIHLIFTLSVFLCPLGAMASNNGAVDFNAVVTDIAVKGDALMQTYSQGDTADIGDEFSELYFDVFEESGMEAAVGAANPGLKSELESLFSTVIGYTMKGAPAEKVEPAWQELRTKLQETAQKQAPNTDYWALLIQAFLILLREGFEAILVITALTTYLKRSGAADKLPVIYHGIGWALIASLATAWLLNTVFEISGAGQETLEGITMLIAAAVLFYVSYWLISKSETSRWQHYVNSQISSALSSGRLFALGFTAFLAVYREGAETVLFYQALATGNEENYSAIAIGALIAAAGLGALYWVMRTASFKLPISLFFTLTAALLYLLAIIFTGKGVLELQEARLIPITPIDWLPRIEWLGLFPSMETALAQASLVIAALIAFALLSVRMRTT